MSRILANHHSHHGNQGEKTEEGCAKGNDSFPHRPCGYIGQQPGNAERKKYDLNYDIQGKAEIRTARQEPAKVGKPAIKQSIKKGMTVRYDARDLAESRNSIVLSQLITSVPKKRTRL